MTYTALSSLGPRIALAISEDLLHWRRLGLAAFAPYHGIDFVHVSNKDASLFPVAIANHAGKMQLALLHRPLFPGTCPEDTACHRWSAGGGSRPREHLDLLLSDAAGGHRIGSPRPVQLTSSPGSAGGSLGAAEDRRGHSPRADRHGWLVVYHGVSELGAPGNDGRHLCYSAGVMVLSREHPRQSFIGRPSLC